MSNKWRWLWQGFRKGLGQGALFGSMFLGLTTYVLLYQRRWVLAAACFITGCITAYLGMKIWIQEDDNE